MSSYPRSLLFSALVLAFGSVACGGGSAPKTPQEAAELALKAIADGSLDTLRPALPTKADFTQLLEASGKADKVDKIDGELAEIEAKVPKALTELQAAAKGAGLDLAAAKLSNVTSKEDVDKEGTEVTITATVTSGDKQAELRLRTMKLERGLVMFRPPRLEVMGVCDRAIANVVKITSGSTDDMAKSINGAFTADPDKIKGDCEKGLGEDPKAKVQIECMATATDWPKLQACMK